MPDFMLAYHGGTIPETEAEQQASMAAWGAWFEEIDASVKDPGNPVGKSSTVSASGVVQNGGANPLSGYTIITAATHKAAETIAKGCPIMGEGGSIEVAEIVEIEM